MLPSERLRRDISKKCDVNLEQYAWPEQFSELVFKIELYESLETNAKMYYGKADLLKGTKNAPNGEHTWTIVEDFLIDTTLMFLIPVNDAVKLGYLPEKKLAYTSARMLSEYDVYDLEYEKEKQKIIKVTNIYKKINVC